MKVWYRGKKLLKFYREDGKVYNHVVRGNKKIKPEKIYKYRSGFTVSRVSKERLEIMKGRLKWFEVKDKKE